MTTFFLDFEGGNDANTGLTFAQRWKSFATGATQARIAPGDTIRVMGSPLPTALGQSATWTNNDEIVTLASAVNADIDECATIWTGATANVTSSLTSTERKEGSQAVVVTVAAGFATGRAAYKSFASKDLSPYQQVSFWVRPSQAITAGTIDLRLCTDTIGAVPVHTIPMPALATGGIWSRVTVDVGVPLNVAIQSVALYVNTDFGAFVLTLDNIVACKAPSSPDSITLDSLIAPHNIDTQPWYSINSIRGTTIRLGSWVKASAGSNGRYYGLTQTVASFKREAIPIVTQQMQENGTIAAEILYSGGWDRTDMSTQDRVTWVRPANSTQGTSFGLIFGHTIALGYWALDKFYFANVYDWAVHAANNSISLRLREVGGAGGNTLLGCESANTSGGWPVENLTFLTGFRTALSLFGTNVTMTSDAVIGKLHCGFTCPSAPDNPVALEIGGTTSALTCRASVEEIKGFVWGVGCYGQARLEVYGCTFGYNTSSDVDNDSSSALDSLTLLVNPTFVSGDITLNITNDGQLELHGVNGDLSDQRYYMNSRAAGSRVITASDRIHSTADKNWKFSATNLPDHRKMERPIGRIAVAAGEEVTVTVWAYRDEPHVQGRLLLRPWLPGIPLAGVAASLTTEDAWEQLAVTFTPTVEGVVELVFQAWTTTTGAGNVWMDDFEAAQEALAA